jgi:hypothetical protein
MNDRVPNLPKSLFILGDILLLGIAGMILFRGSGPASTLDCLLATAAVVVGAILAVVPFIVEYRAAAQLADTELITSKMDLWQNMENTAASIKSATAQWHGIQEQAQQTQRLSRETAERMAADIKSFNEFMSRANDAERATLRLEVDKLRRVEGDWLQVLVGILDHVFALSQAAARSGNPDVARQVGTFQHICRDMARRVGVTQFEAASGEEFDASKHHLPEPDAEAPEDSVVDTLLAPGIAFQGKLLRPVIVTVKPGDPQFPSEASEAPGADVLPEPEVSEPGPAAEPVVESAGSEAMDNPVEEPLEDGGKSVGIQPGNPSGQQSLL